MKDLYVLDQTENKNAIKQDCKTSCISFYLTRSEKIQLITFVYPRKNLIREKSVRLETAGHISLFKKFWQLVTNPDITNIIVFYMQEVFPAALT